MIDVHGDFGYQGCTWIHQPKYLKSDADRKVAAEWPTKQQARVDRSIQDLVALKGHDATRHWVKGSKSSSTLASTRCRPSLWQCLVTGKIGSTLTTAVSTETW